MQPLQAFPLASKGLSQGLQPEAEQLLQVMAAVPQGLGGAPPVRQQGHQGGGGGGGAVVRHQIGNGGVVLMAEPADHGHRKSGQAAGQGFSIEHAEVFAAAAPPGQHQGLDSQGVGSAGQPLERLPDRCLHRPLDRDGHHEQSGRRPAFVGRTEHVGQG